MADDTEYRRGWTLATFTVRLILGLVCLMEGWWRCFGDQMSPAQHAETFFLMPYGEGKTWIPDWLLRGLGVSMPVVELGIGVLLCLGLLRGVAYAALALLLVIVAYGKLLLEPSFDVSEMLLPRLALLVFLWVTPPGRDRLSLDALLKIRLNGRKNNAAPGSAARLRPPPEPHD
jgi:uncharacterized membrane protein YphA (DoxX/SURF4 family)